MSADKKVKLSWEKREKGPKADGTDHLATVNWGTWGASGDCVPADTDAAKTRYECFNEFEWGHLDLIAAVDMAHNQSSATLHKVQEDSRYKAGYRIKESYQLKCK